MVDLRTFTYIDILQPQTASFIATVSQGFLPQEEQSSLIVEIAPGMDINRVTDIALKRTGVRPGMMVVERSFGFLELHSFNQSELRMAGEVILEELGLNEQDRLKPVIRTQQILTGVDAHQTMLVNRMRHGNFLLKGESFLILEVHPAGYAMIAANEAEKAASINILEIRAFGAYGRVYIGGGEADIEAANAAVAAALSSIDGRENAGK
jgi:hypothetical protein